LKLPITLHCITLKLQVETNRSQKACAVLLPSPLHCRHALSSVVTCGLELVRHLLRLSLASVAIQSGICCDSVWHHLPSLAARRPLLTHTHTFADTYIYAWTRTCTRTRTRTLTRTLTSTRTRTHIQVHEYKQKYKKRRVSSLENTRPLTIYATCGG